METLHKYQGSHLDSGSCLDLSKEMKIKLVFRVVALFHIVLVESSCLELTDRFATLAIRLIAYGDMFKDTFPKD